MAAKSPPTRRNSGSATGSVVRAQHRKITQWSKSSQSANGLNGLPQFVLLSGIASLKLKRYWELRVADPGISAAIAKVKVTWEALRGHQEKLNQQWGPVEVPKFRLLKFSYECSGGSRGRKGCTPPLSSFFPHFRAVFGKGYATLLGNPGSTTGMFLFHFSGVKKVNFIPPYKDIRLTQEGHTVTGNVVYECWKSKMNLSVVQRLFVERSDMLYMIHTWHVSGIHNHHTYTNNTICTISATCAKCGVRSTFCWKIANISGSTELFGL